jgi:hypothetical protein
MLESITGFSQLATIHGNLEIWAANLSNTEGFKALKEIDKSLRLSSIKNISDLKGFSNLESIGETLSISYCNQLRSLDGLENVNSVINRVEIRDNSSLSDIQGINNIAAITEYLNIQANLNLNSCSLDLLCERLQTDNINIKVNGPDCNDLNTILSKCN